MSVLEWFAVMMGGLGSSVIDCGWMGCVVGAGTSLCPPGANEEHLQ